MGIECFVLITGNALLDTFYALLQNALDFQELPNLQKFLQFF